ncbi:MAG: N-acetylmuramoyl-L-alanine amidase family protein [Eubacterium sp.]|nr:N-acetylmuramoyl-L-alanine amidase family protein [Eubacterium sp.]
MNRHWKKGLLIAALAGGLALTSVPAPAFAATTSENSALDTTDQGTKRSGWFGANGKWFYYDPVTGEKAVGWKKIAGKATTSWYYFNQYGVMQVGWKLIGGKYYHFDSEGRMQTGWQKISGKWYFLKDGVMKTGWVKLGGYYYYFSQKTGAAVTGWVKTGDKWYYLSPSDYSMITGWRYIDDIRYYFDLKSGAMAVGWKQISGEWYYFKKNGERNIGLTRIGEDLYFFDYTGVMQKNRNIGGVNLAANGKVKQIKFEVDNGVNLYRVTINPDGSFQGTIQYIGDLGTSEGARDGYALTWYKFHGVFSDFISNGSMITTMKVKSFKLDKRYEKEVWNENGEIKATERNYYQESIIEEYKAGALFTLYFLGVSRSSIEYAMKCAMNSSYAYLDLPSVFGDPIEQIYLDNLAGSFNYHGGAGRKIDRSEVPASYWNY